jgi:hypothetical protein
MKILCIGEGPEYRPFHDLRSVPKTGKGLYSGPFPRESRAGIFSLFRNSDRLVGTFSWFRRSEYSLGGKPGWYLPPQKIPIVENRFLQAGKGAGNTKEKSRQCFYSLERNLNSILYMHIQILIS